MIITKIHDGLGNQLFQYAFGRHLALKNKTDLKLDISFFDNNSFRKYALGPFSINAQIAAPEEFDRIRGRCLSRFNTLKKTLFNAKPCYIREEDISFNPIYFNVSKSAAIDGYWQSEKYFIGFARQIRQDLEINIPSSSANALLLSRIQSENSISLHIRRGDYQTTEAINIHGVCSADYYRKAVAMIASKVINPVFYIFSDDCAWARQNIVLDHPAIVVDINNDDTAYEDLRLMANCKHNIIANSTFSWWGAWLNKNPGKVIIAPERWFSNAEMNILSKNIIPESWVKV